VKLEWHLLIGFVPCAWDGLRSGMPHIVELPFPPYTFDTAGVRIRFMLGVPMLPVAERFIR
jgi:hypothetical protein